MNSSAPSEPVAPQAPVQPAFNWIELFPIPIAISIMETQPIALLLLFATPVLSLGANVAPLDELSITLFLLGLQWWALATKHLIQRGIAPQQGARFHTAGLILALLLLVVTHLAMLNAPGMLLVSAGLIVWFWKHGMDRTRLERGEDLLITFFRVGFFILIGVLLVTVLYQDPSTIPVRNALPLAFPLFFLSGLLALSFTRLANISRENAIHGTVQSSATRNWIFALILVWVVIVAMTLGLELYSFQAIQILLVPVWNMLVTVLSWIIFVVLQVIGFIYYIIGTAVTFILNLLGIHGQQGAIHFPQMPSLGKPGTPAAKGSHASNGLLDTIGRIVLLVIGLAVLIVVVRVVQKRWARTNTDDSEEELRESLSMHDIRKERREERQQRQQQDAGPVLESLDAASARARYRDLLQAMAIDSEERTRRPSETPTEYQKRLVALMQRVPAGIEQQADAPADPAILAELTQAYMRERYGGKQTASSEHAFLQKWVPYLVERLKRKLPTRSGRQESGRG